MSGVRWASRRNSERPRWRLPMDHFRVVDQADLTHEVLHVPRVADLPPEASAEKVYFEAQGMRSVLIVPFISGPISGFLGFETVRTEKSWSEESISLLKIVREMLGQATPTQKS